MYHRQLALIHDRGFKDFALSAAGLLLSKIPNPTGPIVDLGCGSGDLLLQFRDKVPFGYGFDISPGMIALCRAKIPDYHFQVAGMFESDFPRAQFISMVGEILSYASFGVDDLDSKLKSFFHKIASKLIPGGRFLFDFLTADGDFNYSSFFDADYYTIMMKSRSSGKIVTREIASFLRAGETYTKAVETHRLRVFEPDRVVDLLRAAGFEVRLLESYGSFSLPAGRMGCLCELKSAVEEKRLY